MDKELLTAQQYMIRLCESIHARSKLPLDDIFARVRSVISHFDKLIVEELGKAHPSEQRTKAIGLSGRFAYGMTAFIHPFVIGFIERSIDDKEGVESERYADAVFEAANAFAAEVAPALAEELLAIPETDDIANAIAEKCARRYFEMGIGEMVAYPHPDRVQQH